MGFESPKRCVAGLDPRFRSPRARVRRPGVAAAAELEQPTPPPPRGSPGPMRRAAHARGFAIVALRGGDRERRGEVEFAVEEDKSV